MEVENTQAAEVAHDAPASAPEQHQITDLDGLSKWSWQGKEYTPDEWHKIASEYQTLSKSREEFETEKKFSEGLQTDIETVLKDPARAQEFKSIYPKKYHFLVDQVLNKAQAPAQAQSTPAQPQLPKEFMSEFEQMKERLSFHEKKAYEAEVQAANAKLDTILPPLFKQFEWANEEQVYAKAEALLTKGQTLTDKTWERLVRESHEAMQKRADQVYGAKVKSQIEKGQQAKDGGPGGAAPGQAPKRRSFEQATEDMVAHVNAHGLRA